jgi:3D-(3,5/4)-trihydroxycyclohexane-1,2-dione acylhydrolase (decyclizing)
VVRFWDRLTHPAQVLSALPQAVATMLSPADCGPAFIGLPQDVAAQADDYPISFFRTQVHEIARPRPDIGQVARAAVAIRASHRPVIIAGGGVHYSRAEVELAEFAEQFGIPVIETVAGKSCLPASHPRYSGPIGVTGADMANVMASEADLILAVGTRLEDFTTGSWTAFDPHAPIVAVNAATFDAIKHFSLPVVGDAREVLADLTAALTGYGTDAAWVGRGVQMRTELQEFVDGRMAPDDQWPPSYAQIIGQVYESATTDDYVMTAAGGLPGELNINWMSTSVASFDCEYGFSCMGYEAAGAWGAAFARRRGEVYSLVGDGSYLMLNSEIYSSVLSGRKFILVVCDNGGFAVIERLQRGKGGASYNNMLADSRGPGADVRVDFRAHAESLGAVAIEVHSRDEMREALAVARAADRTCVIVSKVRASDWTEGGAFWQVGVPEVSDRAEVVEAAAQMRAGLLDQRRGV